MKLYKQSRTHHTQLKHHLTNTQLPARVTREAISYSLTLFSIFKTVQQQRNASLSTGS